ncbi:MAG: hypothetical protein A2297_05660 [Elusimicrobia bacterium RIFOXYB2_FULL_48_7]|nr:MAG: hypothetical protein A2297_05660 [Elusimicrobia bacterium RIFOXYB2_FULL_48_7]
MAPKWFKTYRVNLDGKEVSVAEFKGVCQGKSPRAAEQVSIYQQLDHRGNWFLGFFSGYYGYRRYTDSGNYDPTETSRISNAQMEGILFTALGAVTLIEGHIKETAAIGYLNKAVEYYNEDTGKVVARTLNTREYNLSYLK